MDLFDTNEKQMPLFNYHKIQGLAINYHNIKGASWAAIILTIVTHFLFCGGKLKLKERERAKRKREKKKKKKLEETEKWLSSSALSPLKPRNFLPLLFLKWPASDLQSSPWLQLFVLTPSLCSCSFHFSLIFCVLAYRFLY